MRFENLDSLSPPEVETVERVCAASGHSLSALRKVPVFWVGEALMDKLYDPWRTVLLNPDCVDKALEVMGERIDPEKSGEAFIRDLDRFWERLAECSGKAATVYRPATGVYIRELDEAAVKHIASARRKTGKGGAVAAGAAIAVGKPAAFVCPERCAAEVEGVATSLNEKRALECAVAQVVFHELTHAWLDTDLARYRTPWGRLIEESLCEADSSLHFDEVDEKPDRALVNRLLLDGPIEYRSFRFWNRPERRLRQSRSGFEFDSREIIALWKQYDYESLFSDLAEYYVAYYARRLFGGDFGEFAKANSSLPRARLVELFWKQVARRVLSWIHEEEG